MSTTDSQIDRTSVKPDIEQGFHDISANLQSGDTAAGRDSLLALAGASYTRTLPDSNSLDFGGMDKLYGTKIPQAKPDEHSNNQVETAHPDNNDNHDASAMGHTHKSPKDQKGAHGGWEMPPPVDNTKHAKPEATAPVEDDSPAHKKSEAAWNDPVEMQLLGNERLKLDANIQRLSQTEQDSMQRHMSRFEKVARENNVAPEEVRKTYEQINRLYDSQSDTPVSKPDKDLLAQQIIDHAAHPHYIGQGDHNTCNVTALESRLFSTEPSKASQLIADVATTGQYTAKDGSTVTLDQKDLAKDSNSQANLSANGDGDRSYASQLFQTTALDLHFQTEGKRYRDIPGGNTPSDRNAYGLPDKEEVIDSHGRHKPFTGLNLPAISQIAGKITGENEQGHFWQNANEVDKTQDNRSTTVFKSEVDFEDKLKSHNKTDDYPVVLFVDSSKAPFDDRASLNAGGSGAWHVVTVTGYNEKEREVSYANEHSLSENHLGSEGVPLYVLYQATQKAKTE